MRTIFTTPTKTKVKEKVTLDIYYRTCSKSRSPLPDHHGSKIPRLKENWKLIAINNGELRIAVEVDGEQHNHYLPHFHKTYANFLKQQERDLMKSKMILDRGLRLIRVPYSVPNNDLEKFIMTELNKIL